MYNFVYTLDLQKIYYTEDFRYLVASLEYFTEIYLLLKGWKTATNIAIRACTISFF